MHWVNILTEELGKREAPMKFVQKLVTVKQKSINRDKLRINEYDTMERSIIPRPSKARQVYSNVRNTTAGSLTVMGLCILNTHHKTQLL